MSKKVIDLFSGCGGLSYGFENAGFEIELAIDLWEDAILTYNHNHKNKVGKLLDIHDLTDQELEKFKGKIDGIIGGPPCQGYSTVGTRDINDPRNHLYIEYCRVVEKVQPEFFLIENVRGLLTLGNGMFKKDIVKRFSKLGYNVKFKLLNAADYGIPQNRLRVFFVGLKNNKDYKFPEKEAKLVTTKEAIEDLPSLESDRIKLLEPSSDYQKFMRKNNRENTILNHDITNHTEQTINVISKVPDGGNIKDLPEEYWNIRKYNKAFQRMDSKKPSNTIDTGHRNYFHYKYNRIPTVRESARIQSFPDDFEFLGTKTSQYKQVGNAIPPLLAYKIAKSILKSLEE